MSLLLERHVAPTYVYQLLYHCVLSDGGHLLKLYYRHMSLLFRGGNAAPTYYVAQDDECNQRS